MLNHHAVVFDGVLCLVSPFENVELCINKYSPSRREINSIAQWSGQPGWIKRQVITAASLAALILPRLISPNSTTVGSVSVTSAVQSRVPLRTRLVEGVMRPGLAGD